MMFGIVDAQVRFATLGMAEGLSAIDAPDMSSMSSIAPRMASFIPMS